MSTAAIVAGTAAAGIGGAAISANAAGNAAQDQSQAAEQAAQLQYQESQNALGFQEQEYNQGQQNLQPWLQSGTGALTNLDYLLGVGPQSPSTYGAGNPISVNGVNPAGISSTGANPFGANTPQGYGASPAAQAMTDPFYNSATGGNNGVLNGSTPPTQANPNGGAIPLPSSSPALQQYGASPAAQASGTVRPAGNPGAPALQSGNNGAPASTGGQLPLPANSPALQNYGASPAAQASGAAPASGTSSAGGYGSLLAPYPGQFTAPTAQQALNSPGEQAQLQLGEQALQQSAAAGGNLLTGGTAEALNNYAQNLASTNYNNVYNQAYNTYSSNYNQYEQQQANEYNRLASLAGVGQTAAGQLGTLGQGASNNVSSNLLGTGANIGQQLNNAAAANASGIVGSANAYGGAIGNVGSSISNLALLSQLGGGGGASSSIYPTSDSEYY